MQAAYPSWQSSSDNKQIRPLDTRVSPIRSADDADKSKSLDQQRASLENFLLGELTNITTKNGRLLDSNKGLIDTIFDVFLNVNKRDLDKIKRLSGEEKINKLFEFLEGDKDILIPELITHLIENYPNSQQALNQVYNENSYKNVDVLVITALDEELKGLLSSARGWSKRTDKYNVTYRQRSFRHKFGGVVTVAAACSDKIGTKHTAILATHLFLKLEPRCLAMTGICAGHKDYIALGDVIVAETIFDTTGGELRVDYKENHGRQVGEEKNLPQPERYPLDWRLKQAVQENMKWWKNPYPKPKLETKREAGVIGQHLTTEKSSDSQKHPFHFGSLATGDKVHKDAQVFLRLEGTDRKVRGLDMESSAIGAIAYKYGILMIVIKAVQDYADPTKNTLFRRYASQASARFLIDFLTGTDVDTFKLLSKSSKELPQRLKKYA